MYVCVWVRARKDDDSFYSITEFENQQTQNELALSNWLLANILKPHFCLQVSPLEHAYFTPTFLQLKCLNAEQNTFVLNKKLQ